MSGGRWPGLTVARQKEVSRRRDGSPDRHTIKDMVEALNGLGIPWRGDPENSIRSQCPHHGGTDPRSLETTMDWATGKLLLRCYGGCSFRNVLGAAGLEYQGNTPALNIPVLDAPVGQHIYMTQKPIAPVVAEAFPLASITGLDQWAIAANAHIYKGKTVWVVTDNTPGGRSFRARTQESLRSHTGDIHYVLLGGEETVNGLREVLGPEPFRQALVEAVGAAWTQGVNFTGLTGPSGGEAQAASPPGEMGATQAPMSEDDKQPASPPGEMGTAQGTMSEDDKQRLTECLGCGAWFQARRSTAKYCPGGACRVAAHRARVSVTPGSAALSVTSGQNRRSEPVSEPVPAKSSRVPPPLYKDLDLEVDLVLDLDAVCGSEKRTREAFSVTEPTELTEDEQIILANDPDVPFCSFPVAICVSCGKPCHARHNPHPRCPRPTREVAA